VTASAGDLTGRRSRSPEGKRLTSERPTADGMGEGHSPPMGGSWPAASSAVAHRRGPLPPRGQPRTRPSAVPAATHPVAAPRKS
jgi:hypothetical protein